MNTSPLAGKEFPDLDPTIRSAASIARRIQDPLAEVRDDVDAQVLPIFLEEAAELYPQAGEQVRAWRRNPRDGTAVQHLRRTVRFADGLNTLLEDTSRVLLEVGQARIRQLPRRMLPHRFEDGDDVDRLALEDARQDRAAVDEHRDQEPDRRRTRHEPSP